MGETSVGGLGVYSKKVGAGAGVRAPKSREDDVTLPAPVFLLRWAAGDSESMHAVAMGAMIAAAKEMSEARVLRKKPFAHNLC